jgi:signal peptidase I
LPGERVKIEDGTVTIYNSEHPEGFVLGEEYLPKGVRTLPGNTSEVTLGVDKIFVLGDNRGASLDSRRIGSVSIQNVLGEPIIRGWPLNKIGILKNPLY